MSEQKIYWKGVALLAVGLFLIVAVIAAYKTLENGVLTETVASATSQKLELEQQLNAIYAELQSTRERLEASSGGEIILLKQGDDPPSSKTSDPLNDSPASQPPLEMEPTSAKEAEELYREADITLLLAKRDERNLTSKETVDVASIADRLWRSGYGDMAEDLKWRLNFYSESEEDIF
jgi:hypothetical protein